MPLITDWISSIAALVGGLAGIGALVVAILSYARSSRALRADADTRIAVGSTFRTVEALGAQSVAIDEAVAAALRRRKDTETHDFVVHDGLIVSRLRADVDAAREAYEREAHLTRHLVERLHSPAPDESAQA